MPVKLPSDERWKREHEQDSVKLEGHVNSRSIDWIIKVTSEVGCIDPPMLRVTVLFKAFRNWRIVGSFVIELHKLFWAKGYSLLAERVATEGAKGDGDGREEFLEDPGNELEG